MFIECFNNTLKELPCGLVIEGIKIVIILHKKLLNFSCYGLL